MARKMENNANAALMWKVNEFRGEHEEIKTVCVWRKNEIWIELNEYHRSEIGEESLSLLTTHVPPGEKPTVAGGVDAFQKGTFGLEAGDAVPLAVERLQLGEDAGVELRQPVVPYVQLGHVSQQVGLIWDHTGDLIQPDRG